MGRRAKHKQGAPEPLAEANGQTGRPSAKKLGKRKAEFEDDSREPLSKRPTKKAKESEKGKVGKSAKSKPSAAETKNGAKVKADKAPSGKKKHKAVEEDEEEQADAEVDEGGSSAGWEDVEDGGDFAAQTKYVL